MSIRRLIQLAELVSGYDIEVNGDGKGTISVNNGRPRFTYDIEAELKRLAENRPKTDFIVNTESVDDKTGETRLRSELRAHMTHSVSPIETMPHTYFQDVAKQRLLHEVLKGVPDGMLIRELVSRGLFDDKLQKQVLSRASYDNLREAIQNVGWRP